MLNLSALLESPDGSGEVCWAEDRPIVPLRQTTFRECCRTTGSELVNILACHVSPPLLSLLCHTGLMTCLCTGTLICLYIPRAWQSDLPTVGAQDILNKGIAEKVTTAGRLCWLCWLPGPLLLWHGARGGRVALVSGAASLHVMPWGYWPKAPAVNMNQPWYG